MAQITLNSSGVASNGALALQSNGTTTAVTIDTSQNVGIGVTPSAWNASSRVIQFGTNGTAALENYSGITAALYQNAYRDSAANFKYVTTNFATNYYQYNGQHVWQNAPSGTAGNAITFTQAMTLDASGNLTINSDNSALIFRNNYQSITTDASGNNLTYRTYQNHIWLTATSSSNTTSGTERMRIDSSGNLLVGTTSSTGRIGSKAATTDNTGYGIYVEDSASALMFYARNDGVISTGAKSASPYNNTTASAANMFVSSAGVLQRSTSSLKYKTNVQDATHGLTKLLTLRSVTYEGKAESDVGKTFGGLIAEEVHEAGLTEFVQYAEDGSPDALAYGNMVSLCIKAIQEQQALIQQLTDRITALEAK